MFDITIQASDNSGSFGAYVARPNNGGKRAPGIIVIQEIFGVNKVMRDICDDLAAQGYLAVCPDIFWRQEPGVNITDQTQAEWDKAFELFNGFDVDKGVEDLIATLNYTRTMDGCSGKVGDIGYCLGGKLAYLMACHSDADCSVSYYGVDIVSFTDEAKNVRHPLLMHMAENDKFVPAEDRDTIIKELKRYDLISKFVYDDVDHAFARKSGEHYDEDMALKANNRTSDFLQTYLG